MKSDVEMNCAGCPAIDGTAGLGELPFSPWQAAQRFGSAAKAAAEMKTATASAVAFWISLKLLLCGVADPVDDAVVVVRHQHRAVAHHQDVDRPAPHRRIGLLVGHEAGEERHRLARLAVLVDLYAHHVVALLDGPVPRAMHRDEDVALVLGREHLAV